MNLLRIGFALAVLLVVPATTFAADGNRLTYLDENDPYYVSRTFPRLVTPQWVGEEGVEAVVVLAIDDMRGHEKWEKFLRPILQRLKRIDGRAPVSIMTCSIDPKEPHLQKWLKEGLSLETHTFDHPCPLLCDGNLAKAKATYNKCVDLLANVPGSKPVAFRVPCCDSLNTPSPRFYAEIFNKTTPRGNFLSLDSSVFNVISANDPKLPRALVLERDGSERFRKYLPRDRSFVNTIEDYPYPYVLGRLCWEFPCVTPSDWSAHHYHRSSNPVTIRDWKAALDATVIKQGTFNLVFHPHGWIRAEQIVDFIDHAVSKHGKKVKFLTFRECDERLTKNLLGGQRLRAANGQDNGVRLIDVDNDGYLDVVIGNENVRQTRVWSPKTRSWTVTNFPVQLIIVGQEGDRSEAGARFGVVRPDGRPTLLMRNEKTAGAWHFDGGKWVEDKTLLAGLELDGRPIFTGRDGRDRGVRLRDLDRDGCCELIVSNDKQQAIFSWKPAKKRWEKLPFALPSGTSLVDAGGKDRGLRFVDIDEDGHDDVIMSNEDGYALYLFTSMKDGWSRRVLLGKRGDVTALPPISLKGTNAGAWFHSRHLWVQNENTNLHTDHVERRSFNEMLASVEPTAKSPEASLRSIRVKPGYIVELVAAEPLVQSPIAFAWGPDGKLWVVEMGDYPLGADGKGKPGGRVKYLESTKGDGKYDKATVFLDGLSFPTGVTPWRKGVIVTCAPDIFYAEDTKGTGKADLRVPLYTGFVEGNPQHRVNGLVWGLDNWLYGANGDSGGRIKSAKTGKVVDIGGRDFRIRPDNGGLDAVTGGTQYGRNRDDWDNWFGNNNSNPLWHFVLADHYIRRNPHIAAPQPRVHVPNIPGAARVFPVSRTLPRFNDPQGANHFTSACSPIIYRDDLFYPPGANGSSSPVYVFISEPVHNLVHREVMSPKGVTFSSQRAADEQESEFLASSDNWFRPTMTRTGPDGALWIADMYRHVIEHPEWIPKEWQKKLDLRAGHDKGRIYCVYPVGAKPRPIPRLDKLSTAGLVAALDSPNGWQRDMAQQMLLWRKDKSAVAPLKKMALDCNRPLARLHALCTLDGLSALEPSILEKALADANPGVRRHAVRLSEPLLAKSPKLAASVVKRVTDADAHVRLQLAYSLGQWDDVEAGRALGQLALRDSGDPYLMAAMMSSVNKKNLEPVLLAVLEGGRKSAPAPAVVESLLRLANALGNRKALTTLLNTVAQPENGKYAAWQFAALAGTLDALDQSNSSLKNLRDGEDADLKATVKRLDGLFTAARAAVADKKSPRESQLLAVRLLGRGLDHQQEDVKLLAGLLVPQVPADLQAAAVSALGGLRDAKVPEVLLSGWKGYGPALRSQVFDVLIRRQDWLKAILDALERKEVLPIEIDAGRRQRLLQHRTPAIRERAAKLFADAVNPDREKVVQAYRTALTLRGDTTRGVQVFAKHCASCHRFQGVGKEVGPDLASLGDKSPEALLIAILDPNRAVEAKYINYIAMTKSGLSFSGLLASETGNSVTLVSQDGKRQTILRTELEELSSTDKSLMPEGLEKELKLQDVADVIAHLRSGLPQPKAKTFEGNKPELVRPGKDGTLRLPASACAIYGNTLVFEKKHGNLGYWNSADDHAAWTIELSKPGKYAVWLDYACADASAGNTFALEAGGKRLTSKVAGTGDWDTYKRTKVGEIELRAGKQEVVFRPAGKLREFLIDLKSVELVAVASR
jgi:putative membrane-bound dehydrogenase-like protein